jgi:predicted O-linked N-acetylglucosamine transferase (SPINDLY family)
VPQALLGYGRALAAAPDAAETESNLLQCLQFDETVDDDALARQHRLWARRHVAAPALGDAAFENRRDPDRRLSIGYVSADLGRHPVGFFLLPAIEAHDRAQVQVTCYATRDLGDELTAALRAASDSWVDASRLDDDALAHRIRADGIDILVDLSGHTAHHRLLVFGRRPAPVQATWLGYFDSCGLEQIDYLLTDDWEVPKTGRDRFIEEVIGLPSGRFAYRPPAYAPLPTRRETRAAIVFGCFNQLAKLSQAAIRVWSRILQARPDARLLLKWSSLADERVADSVRRRFGRHGVAADRLVLRGASDHASMLAEYGDIDIALDPFPFSGCLTTMEALWMGVPAVTLAGRRPVARQSAAILWRLGLADLVTDDEASYVATALALAEDSGRRQRLRTDLRGLMQASTLLDGRACAASLEQAYRIMWRRWCERPVSPAPR